MATGDMAPLHSQNTRKGTRSWIITAFNRLVMRRPYGAIGVAELTRSAGVGRSTFYEHFDGKDEVLRNALSPVLTPLADLATDAPAVDLVVATLVHFRHVQPRALAMLDSSTRVEIERALSDLIQARLQAPLAGQRRDDPSPSTSRLLASAIAGAQLSLIRAWLATPAASHDVHAFARELTTISRAMARSSLQT